MEMYALKVLVVDDSPIITRKICMMMEMLGYRVVKTAGNGREAIAAYRECRPDLVTMDITMPEMDGIEATRHIRREFPQANIIMVTSHGQEKMVFEALKAGAKGYVLKPFQQQRLVAVIEKACNSVMLVDKLQFAVAQREGKLTQATPEATEPPSNAAQGVTDSAPADL